MRKLIPILMLSFLAAGCYEEILIPTEDKEPVLVMNAQMTTHEYTHTIYLSLSRLSKVEPLPGASVKVYVNGTLVAEAEEQKDDDYSWNTTAYRFLKSFHPGDEVRIEARKDAFNATATVIVPPEAAIESIDTSSVRLTYLDDTSDYVQIKVRFKDLPGASWYGVDHRTLDVWRYLDEEGNPIPRYDVVTGSTGGIDTDFDPVISEGSGKTADGDLGALLSASNYYHCFSDDPIADQECTLRVMMNPWYFYLPSYRYGIYVPSWMEEDDDAYTKLMAMPVRLDRWCFFRLRSLDFSQYHYLKALNNLETFGTEVNFLVEPTTLPSNVEGGLGFVGIETITETGYAHFKREYGPVDTIIYY